jgi:hypothetical protein
MKHLILQEIVTVTSFSPLPPLSANTGRTAFTLFSVLVFQFLVQEVEIMSV